MIIPAVSVRMRSGPPDSFDCILEQRFVTFPSDLTPFLARRFQSALHLFRSGETVCAVCDRNGHIRHDGGVVTGAPGLYLLGMPVLRTRASTYIHGARADSGALACHLHSFLSGRRR